jgi:peptide/nickel transport system substrate-binding protein
VVLARRSAIGLLLGGGAAALLAACSTTPAPAANPVPAQPRAGGTLRVGVLGDLQSLDGHMTTGVDSLNRVWNPLTALDEKLDTLPVLAERFELSPDGRQMQLTLRRGVQFHTGRELTSDDVVWNFNRLKDPKVNPVYANLVKPFAAVENPDRYTVVVRFDAPDPFVIDALPVLAMIDPVTFEQTGPNTAVGTGPFRFAEWVQGDHLTLKRNARYWDAGKPYLDQLEFKIFTDPQAMVTQYEAGALDLAIQPSLTDWVRLRQAQQDQALLNANSGNYLACAFNVTQPPTDNKLVRQALQHALDRERCAATVWQGVERPLVLLWFPTSPAYDPAKNTTYAFDLERAKALLGQAGLSSVALDYNYPSTAPEFGLIGQIWQQDLAKIGVTLTLKPTDPVALNTSMVRVAYQGVAVGTGYFGQLHGGVVWTSPYYGPVNNRSGYKDDAYTQLTLAVYSEVDAAKLKQAYAAWNDYVLDQSFVTAISTQYPRALAKPNVRGLMYSTGGTYLDLTAAWLA